MVITRPRKEDDAEVEVEGEVSGTWCPAEPEVGLRSGFEDVEFVNAYGEVIVLTSEEQYRALELLMEEFHDGHGDGQ
jgi:hypothetical protein